MEGLTAADLLKEKREKILQIAARHGVSNIRVFGSASRGDAGPDSDIDFLIETRGPTSPWFPGGLVAELEQLLGRRVDVVEPEALREGLKERVLREAISL